MQPPSLIHHFINNKNAASPKERCMELRKRQALWSAGTRWTETPRGCTEQLPARKPMTYDTCDEAKETVSKSLRCDAGSWCSDTISKQLLRRRPHSRRCITLALNYSFLMFYNGTSIVWKLDLQSVEDVFARTRYDIQALQETRVLNDEGRLVGYVGY